MEQPVASHRPVNLMIVDAQLPRTLRVHTPPLSLNRQLVGQFQAA